MTIKKTGKNKAAAALGKLGAQARWKGTTAKERREAARKAGIASGKARAKKAAPKRGRRTA